MKKKWLTIALLVVTSTLAATIAAAGAAWLSFWASAKYFIWMYPHDGQDVLGAVGVGLFAGIGFWAVGFWQSFYWQWKWIKTRDVRQLVI